MDYQSKTTVITIHVGKWTEKTDTLMSSRFAAAHAIAAQIASRCQMDIMSLACHPLDMNDPDPDCAISVVYVNNGRSLGDIREMMVTEMNNYPKRYWMIQDIYMWEGLLDCVATTRGTNEEWR